MKKYTEYVWGITFKSQLQLEGQSRIPKVSCDPIKIPVGTSREEEVKFLSMFYKNNPLNGFLFTIDREKCPSPLCECLLEGQTAFHILTSCPKVDSDIREEIILMLLLGNDVATADALIADNISLLNCSRDEMFVQQCLKALRTSSLKLSTKITLSKKSHILGQPNPWFKQVLEPYSSFFPAVFGKTKSRCTTQVTTVNKPDIAITIPCYLIPHKLSNKLTYTFWFTVFCTCIFAFYRKRALYTLHFSNVYSCNYLYIYSVNI